MTQPSPNRLFHEKSPYLLQHAYNPVNWYPWGDEAFKEAKRRDKPIFLSIGYSTCHWCHVMEHESFTDQEVADLMNEAFINIKVDREERPDIDGVYMAVSQMLTGGGGWPLTIIMTPDGKPFYSATYIPKENRFNVVGMLDLVPQITNYWETQRERMMGIGDNVASSLSTRGSGGGEDLTESVLDTGFMLLEDRYDDEYGGLGDAPKFPSPHNLLFLLRYWKRTGKKQALVMVENTLQKMSRGGIFDQVGYGFHRYSTDREWLVPHFEKMLYDQAMLLMVYTEAYQATGKEEYKETAEQTIAYVLRDLTSTYGGFYSAEDADSEGEEGKFYVWTVDELQRIAGDENQDVLVYLGVKPGGNYLDEATKEKTGTNILHVAGDDPPVNLEAVKNRLFEERERRERPLLDDKILTDWNGLMIAALSKAARAFQVKEYAEEAVRSAEFLLGNMWDGDELLHRYREGEAQIGGFLDDYAFMVWGLIELYQATHEKRFLDEARRINEVMMDMFADPEGGFYFTSSESEELLTRRKDLYDGAIPSGNSVAFMNMMKLSRLTGNTSLEEEAAKLSRFFSSSVLGAPHAYSMLLSGLDFAFGPSTEVVVSGKKEDIRDIISQLDRRYLPNTVIHRYSTELATSVGYISGMKPGDSPMIYVCTGFVCSLPTGNMEKMWELLGEG
ncbi:MAG: thioredoxin domain-containing protein [Candidatus Bathyarchaeota archaeon]